MGPTKVIDSIQPHIPPWSVNHLAQVAGQAALEDENFRRTSLRVIREASTRMKGLLLEIPGLTVFPSKVNFFMMRLPEGSCVSSIVSKLGKKGVLVRDCSNFSGVTNPAIRVAIRGHEENARLVRLLKNCFQKVPNREGEGNLLRPTGG